MICLLLDSYLNQRLAICDFTCNFLQNKKHGKGEAGGEVALLRPAD